MRVQVLTFNDESDEDVLGRIVITHAEVSGTLKSVTITGEVETVQGGSLPVGWLPRVGNPIVGTWRLTSFEVKGHRLEVKSVPAVSTLTGARTVFSLAWQRVT